MLCYVMLCELYEIVSIIRNNQQKADICNSFCRAMHKRGLCRHAVCVCVSVSVCVSVTFVSCVKTNKDIFEIFFHHRAATPL